MMDVIQGNMQNFLQDDCSSADGESAVIDVCDRIYWFGEHLCCEPAPRSKDGYGGIGR